MAFRSMGLLMLVVASIHTAPLLAQTAPQPAPPSDVSRSAGSLSDKLSDTGGVIHPQGSVDPDIQKVPPVEGRMPVIKPPGASGGDPAVVPK